jgi:hypothetical protein
LSPSDIDTANVLLAVVNQDAVINEKVQDTLGSRIGIALAAVVQLNFY